MKAALAMEGMVAPGLEGKVADAALGGGVREAVEVGGLREGAHTGQVGATTTCSQNKHVGEFLYFKLPKLPVQVKSRAIKDVTKYVLNTDVQFTN